MSAADRVPTDSLEEHSMKRTFIAAFTGAALAASLAVSTPALAKPRPPSTPPQLNPLATGLFSPLSLAVDGSGTVYATQNFIGQLDRIGPDGSATSLYSSTDGSEVGGVSVHGQTVTFTVTGPQTAVMQRDARGKVSMLADVGTYEATANPDGDVIYGIPDLPDACAAAFPDEAPSSYPGIVESHPYATTWSQGSTYLADAAGNSILKIDQRGNVSTLAVLPPQGVKITTEAAEANGLPPCAVGYTYLFEPVPTDVEAGPGGMLYVSLLPGAPEDDSLGARGAVYTVDPRTGETTRVASGLAGATDLAVTQHGDVYVSELFGGRISLIKKGSHEATTWVNTLMPSAVETTSCSLYAITHAMVGADDSGDAPGGMIVKAPLNAVPCGH